jgi:hypothetical protein
MKRRAPCAARVAAAERHTGVIVDRDLIRLGRGKITLLDVAHPG